MHSKRWTDFDDHTWPIKHAWARNGVPDNPFEGSCV